MNTNTSVIKIAFKAILIFTLISGLIPNSKAEVKFLGGYNYEIRDFNIDYANTSMLIRGDEMWVENLKKVNADTKLIESTIASSRSALENAQFATSKESQKNNLNDAFQLALKAYEMAASLGLSYDINIINSEINNATSIGADTKAASTKLEEAKKALSKSDIKNAQYFAIDSYKMSINSSVGYKSIKDLISSESKYNGHTVETSGFIRDIKSYSSFYNFVLDDGNGAISITYYGGLGDIKEGDTVSAKGIYTYSGNGRHIDAKTANKGNRMVGSPSSDAKAPGFEAILAIIAISIIGALWLRRKLWWRKENEIRNN